jgi:hypothetical protein
MVTIKFKFNQTCFDNFVNYMREQYPNVDYEDLYDYLKEQSNDDNMRFDGIVLSIEDGELSIEEGGNYVDLGDSDVTIPCQEGGRKLGKMRRKIIRKKSITKKGNTRMGRTNKTIKGGVRINSSNNKIKHYKCKGKRDGVRGCRTCCMKYHKKTYKKCINKCMK